MARRSIKRRPLRKQSIGDMRTWIGLYSRDVQPPGYNESSIEEEYTLILNVWSKHVTFDPGEKKFTDVDLGTSITDSFEIRYVPDITSETKILFGGNYYEIIRVEDFEGREEYLKLYSKQLGLSTLDANT